MKRMATILGSLVALATLNNLIMLPLIRGTIREDTIAAIEHHRAHGSHPDFTSGKEFEHLREDIREFRTECRVKFSSLEKAVADR